MRPFRLRGGSQLTIRLFIVISLKRSCVGGPGSPASVCTVIGADRGPSPAGLNASIWIRYSVYLSRKTRLCAV
uniref:Putative secreted peptide n=1 Tax=Anopheles braziliensis TaxID=58242 RepID=A0A2M3ZX37_9DIPT